jgi:hypothetical protein
MGRRPSEERGRYWREVITRQRRSRQSVAAFCRQQEVSPAAFYGWRRRLADGRSGRSAEVSFVPLPLDQAVPGVAAEFSLQLPNGVQVTVPRNFEGAGVRRPMLLALPQASFQRAFSLVADKHYGGGQDVGGPSVARPSFSRQCRSRAGGARVAAGEPGELMPSAS